MRISHKKKGIFFNWDNFFSMLLIIFVLKFLPIIFYLDFLDPIQNTLEDFQISDLVFSRIIEEKNIPVDSNVILINISRLQRDEIAHLLEIVIENDPKVIGLDAFFIDRKEPSSDSLLSNVISRAKNLVLVSKLTDLDTNSWVWNGIILSDSMFSKNTFHGYANLILDEDSTRTVRMFTPYQIVKDDTINSFAVEIVKLYDEKAYQLFYSRGNELEIISFKGNTNKFHTIDYTEFFKGDRNFSELKGKIALLGYIGPKLNVLSNEDIFYTPLNDKYVGKSYPDMYGVVIWANIIAMILDQNHYYIIPDWLSQVLIFFILYFVVSIYTLIRYKLSSVYESFTIIWNLASIFLFAFIIALSFYLLKIDLHIEGIFFGLIISKQIYEVWVDSLKLFILDFVRQIKGQTLIIGED